MEQASVFFRDRGDCVGERVLDMLSWLIKVPQAQRGLSVKKRRNIHKQALCFVVGDVDGAICGNSH